MSNQPFVDNINDEIVDLEPVRAGMVLAGLVRRLACTGSFMDSETLRVAADLIQAVVDPDLEQRRREMHVAVEHNRLRLSIGRSAAIN